MCGIIAILSKKDIIKEIICALYQLQNRGYDSVGIGYINDNNIFIKKYASTNTSDSLDKLKNNSKNTNSNCVIGHTRWATHGPKTKINAHPHYSMNKKIYLVHNGIIENYSELKQCLIDEEYIFYSQTDTEVIANLIEYYYIDNSIEVAIKKTTQRLSGTYGLCIMCSDKLNKIYVIRKGSPLLVGKNECSVIVTSEVSGFNNLVNNYIVIDNNDLVVLEKNTYTTNKSYKENIVNHSDLSLSCKPYKHWMIKEIYEQENTILRTINNGGRIKDNHISLGGLYNSRDLLKNVTNIILLGCGTSYFACMIGKIYFQNFNVFDSIQYLDGSDFTDKDIPRNGVTLLILCSQSGETKDLHRCLEIGSNKNCIMLGVVNVVDSLIAREVHCGVYLNACREVSVASTKSFTSMCLVLSLISIWFYQLKVTRQNTNIIRNIKNIQCLSKQIGVTLDICKTELLKYLYKLDKRSMFILGRGKMEAVSREGSLKIKEVSYIHAEGYSTSSLKHGPFALLEVGFPVILVIDTTNKYFGLNAYEEIKSRGAFILVITEIEDLEVNEKIVVPYNKDYQEIINVVVFQYLAYLLSIKKRINPDKPRNLAKVVTVL